MKSRAKSHVKSPAKFLASILLLPAALLSVSACVPLPLVLTAASVTAVDVKLDRRTPGTYLDDNTLELKLRHDIRMDPAIRGGGANVSVTVYNGVVLLTGQVNSDEQRQRAGALAEQYKRTGEAATVVNELTLAGKTNISSRINDAWITGKVKAKLLRAPVVPVSAVKVVTEHGKVYLLGRVTQAEADAAVDSIRNVSGITHIVKVFEFPE